MHLLIDGDSQDVGRALFDRGVHQRAPGGQHHGLADEGRVDDPSLVHAKGAEPHVPVSAHDRVDAEAVILGLRLGTALEPAIAQRGAHRAVPPALKGVGARATADDDHVTVGADVAQLTHRLPEGLGETERTRGRAVAEAGDADGKQPTCAARGGVLEEQQIRGAHGQRGVTQRAERDPDPLRAAATKHDLAITDRHAHAPSAADPPDGSDLVDGGLEGATPEEARIQPGLEPHARGVDVEVSRHGQEGVELEADDSALTGHGDGAVVRLDVHLGEHRRQLRPEGPVPVIGGAERDALGRGGVDGDGPGDGAEAHLHDLREAHRNRSGLRRAGRHEPQAIGELDGAVCLLLDSAQAAPHAQLTCRARASYVSIAHVDASNLLYTKSTKK